MSKEKTSSELIIEALKKIKYGQVASYSELASRAGVPGGARTVARLLHSCSVKYDLPWWRVVKVNGEIALQDEEGRNLQRELLLKEGVKFKSLWVVEI